MDDENEVTMVLCERAERRPDLGRWDLLAVAGSWSPSTLPAPLPGSVYVRVVSAAEPPTKEYLFEFQRPDGTAERLRFAAPPDYGLQGPLEMAVPVGSLLVVQPGTHRFVLFADGKPIGSYTFEVVNAGVRLGKN